MDEPKQDDQLEPTYSSSGPIWDVVLKTYRKQWTIEKGGFVFLEMANFSNTINHLATQMNNETSFKKHNKERFIIVAGVKK